MFFHGKTLNTNESINNIIWTKCPKNIYVQQNVFKMGVSSVVINFNDGNCGILNKVKNVGIDTGYCPKQFNQRKDESHIQRMNKKSNEQSKMQKNKTKKNWEQLEKTMLVKSWCILRNSNLKLRDHVDFILKTVS